MTTDIITAAALRGAGRPRSLHVQSEPDLLEPSFDLESAEASASGEPEPSADDDAPPRRLGAWELPEKVLAATRDSRLGAMRRCSFDSKAFGAFGGVSTAERTEKEATDPGRESDECASDEGRAEVPHASSLLPLWSESRDCVRGSGQGGGEGG